MVWCNTGNTQVQDLYHQRRAGSLGGLSSDNVLFGLGTVVIVLYIRVKLHIYNYGQSQEEASYLLLLRDIVASQALASTSNKVLTVYLEVVMYICCGFLIISLSFYACGLYNARSSCVLSVCIKFSKY